MKYLMFILALSVFTFSDQIIPVSDCGIAATVTQEGKACFRGINNYGTRQGAPSLPVINGQYKNDSFEVSLFAGAVWGGNQNSGASFYIKGNFSNFYFFDISESSICRA